MVHSTDLRTLDLNCFLHKETHDFSLVALRFLVHIFLNSLARIPEFIINDAVLFGNATTQPSGFQRQVNSDTELA